MTEVLEVAIIGSGPAGIAAAATAVHHGVPHVLLEKRQLANTIFDYQKGKRVMAEPRKLPLNAKVPFSEGTREQLLAMWTSAVRDAGIHFKQAEVRSIKRVGDHFEINHGETTRARNVVLSIGVQGTPRKLGVPGEDLPHVAYTLADPDAFEGKHIVVVGAGDAGIENALALASKNTVSLVNRTTDFSRAKDGNVKLISEAIQEKAVRHIINASIARIEAERVFIDTAEGVLELRCDRIIVRAGAIAPRSFLESCGIKLPPGSDSLPVVDGRYESNVPGIFVVGALAGYPLIKQAMNQGHEVIEHILGRPVEPADAVLIRERFLPLSTSPDESYRLVRENTPIFSELTEPQFRDMIIDSTVHLKMPGDVVFERLDYTDSFWSIVSGSVEVPVTADKKFTLPSGTFFGELGLLSGRRRSATVVAKEPSILLETPRKQMLKLLRSAESVKAAIDETFMLRLLRTGVFPEASPEALQELVREARIKTFKKNEVLFRQGDPGDAFYVIRKGSVRISVKDPAGVDITRRYVPAGNFVGEMALLKEEPILRSATVTAIVACEAVVLEKTAFQRLLATSPRVKESMQRSADARRFDDAAGGHDRKKGEVLDFMFREGLTDASNVLIIDSALCVGCDNCESACAATHGGESRLDRKGGKFFDTIQVPISCRHCENPLCMTDCPPDALTRQLDGEVIIRDSCIGCGNCVSNCPYGVIRIVHDAPKGFDVWAMLGLRKKKAPGPAHASKCDMCSSLPAGPACVRACPTGAAVRISPAELDRMIRKRSGAERG